MRWFRILAAALALLLWSGPALAEVTVTFYAHPGNRVSGGYLLFPHAYLHAEGTLDDTGETVDWSAGFTARNPGPQLLFMAGVGVVAEPDQRYVHQGRPYVAVTLADAAYRALRARADWWASPEGSRYDLRRRNCITFIADMARMAGLTTGKEPSMSPGRFMEELVALNPLASLAGEDRQGVADSEPATPAAPAVPLIEPASEAGAPRG
jgi:hypothetical protein